MPNIKVRLSPSAHKNAIAAAPPNMKMQEYVSEMLEKIFSNGSVLTKMTEEQLDDRLRAHSIDPIDPIVRRCRQWARLG